MEMEETISCRFFKNKVLSVFCKHIFTWHDDKGTLWLHGNQTGAKYAGSVSSRDSTHSTRLLQTLTEGLQVPPAQ